MQLERPRTSHQYFFYLLLRICSLVESVSPPTIADIMSVEVALYHLNLLRSSRTFSLNTITVSVKHFEEF